MLKALCRLVLLLSLAWIAPLSAEEQNDPFCLNAGGSAMEVGHCVDKRFAAEEKNLEESYWQAHLRVEEEEKALKQMGLNPSMLAAFESSQRAWQRYRDAECEFEATLLTPSPWLGIHQDQCRLKSTIKRIAYLQTVLVE